jgi:hypothetical protein
MRVGLAMSSPPAGARGAGYGIKTGRMFSLNAVARA